MKTLRFLPVCLIPLSLFGCGGGGSSSPTTIAGLTGPGQISIITADDSVVGSGGGGGIPASVFPPDSAYLQEKASVHIFDPSMEGLQTINSILCTVGMSAYGDMINVGDYKAQFEDQLCDSEGPGDDTQGQSAGGTPDSSILTVNSSRATATSPQIVKIWVPQGAETIYANMELTEGASSANPFGIWALTWASAADFAGTATPEFRGQLNTKPAASGFIGFDFSEDQGDVDAVQLPGERASFSRVSVEMSEDQTAGKARLLIIDRENNGGGDTGQQITDVKVVFDATHMKTKSGADPEVTLSRTTFHNAVHRYNLYHAEGAQIGDPVDLFSGFGFQTGAGEYGWMGYWGMWLQSGAVNNGDTITRFDGSANDGDAYTVIKAPGKMMRNTRSALDLTDIGGITFEWWEAGTRFLVDYDGTDFRKISSWSDPNQSWVTLGVPVVIDVAAAGGRLEMWSQSLGGSVTYLDGSENLNYFSRSFVNGSDDLFLPAVGGNIQLLGLMNCLGSELSGADVEAGNVYLADAVGVGAPHIYRFNQDTLNLELDVNGNGTVFETVGLASGQAPASGPYVWGFNSGPMVTDLTGMLNLGDIWDVPVYFTYETGHNDWNKYTAVQDALGATVLFDAPIQFLYQHTTEDDLNDDATYDGESFLLQYEGTGNLHGFPHIGTDLNGDGIDDVYQPAINIKAGVVMGPAGTEYVLRPMSIEQTLTLDPGGAPGLDITDADGLVLPDLSGYVAPTIGEVPVVLDAPRVINGVVIPAE